MAFVEVNLKKMFVEFVTVQVYFLTYVIVLVKCLTVMVSAVVML